MRRAVWFLTDRETGARLCNDGLMRVHHAPIGTGSGCVKFYRSLGWARRRAGTKYDCIALYDGDSLDAAGNVCRKD